MAKKDENTLERILSCAKSEFIEKGYLNASLRTIAKKANTTTGSIYSSFKDKEGLYDVIVGPHYQYMMDLYVGAQESFRKLDKKEQMEHMSEYSGDAMKNMLCFCYKDLELSKLLILGSKGTKYEHMLDCMVEIEIQSTHDYQKTLNAQGIVSPPIDSRLEHMIITGMFNTFLELIVHEVELNEALHYLEQMREFYCAGWAKILGQ